MAEFARRGEIAGVQYLRFLAATMVVYFHTTVYTDQFAWASALPRDFGESGVDVFFLISGFVMMMITADNAITPAQFLFRRIIRIVPLYWAVTLLIALIGVAYPAAMLNNEVSVGHLLLSLLFIPHANPHTGDITPFFKLGWTLNYEMYFYALFAVLILVRSLERRLLLLVGYAALISIVFAIVQPEIAIVRIYTNPIIFEFVMGAAAGYLYVRGYLARLSSLPALVLLLYGLAILLSFANDDDTRVCLQGIAGLALLCSVLAFEARGRLPRIGGLVLLGNASYSIYLVHPLVESVIRVGAKLMHLPVDRPAVGMPLVVIAVLGSVVGGLIAHRLIEMPLLAWLKGLARPSPGTEGRRRLAARIEAVAGR